jgi:hypothetical protein
MGLSGTESLRCLRIVVEYRRVGCVLAARLLDHGPDLYAGAPGRHTGPFSNPIPAPLLRERPHPPTSNPAVFAQLLSHMSIIAVRTNTPGTTRISLFEAVG